MRLTDHEIALITLFGGAAISLGSTWAQRTWTRRDVEDQRTAERIERVEAARRDQVINACEEILRQQVRARSLITAHQDLSTLPEELSDVSEEIDRLSVFIPDEPLRQQLENLASFLWWADSLDVDEQPGVIAWQAANEIGAIAGCMIRGEDWAVPDWYNPRLAAFERAEQEHKDLTREQATGPTATPMGT